MAAFQSEYSSRNPIQKQALPPKENRLPPAIPTSQNIEVPMATEERRPIIESTTEARQAERGPSVLALLTVSTGLAVLILGVIWFVFFRT